MREGSQKSAGFDGINLKGRGPKIKNSEWVKKERRKNSKKPFFIGKKRNTSDTELDAGAEEDQTEKEGERGFK